MRLVNISHLVGRVFISAKQLRKFVSNTVIQVLQRRAKAENMGASPVPGRPQEVLLSYKFAKP